MVIFCQNQGMQKNIAKKLRVGWFTFSCSEDTTMMMIEALNNRWHNWQERMEFVEAKVFRKEKKAFDRLDIAFIEGAIASKRHEEELKQIRGRTKLLIAIGSCAVTGMPSAQRNLFDEKTREEIQPILENFFYSKKVKKVDEVVQVDLKVPGCPVDEEKIIEVFENLFKDPSFGEYA